jgi:hypothetical protein
MQNSVAKKIFAVGVAAATALMGVAPFVASAAAHAVGTNVNYQGTIWMVMPGNCRAAYTSAGAFLSYGFNSWSTVVEANAEDLALPVCSTDKIPPQDGKLITSDRGADKGTTYLISGATKRGFTSAAVFTALGFKFSRGTVGDVSFLPTGANIDNGSSAHLPGVLVNNNKTIQLVGQNGLMGIPDEATLNSWGYSYLDVVTANSADKAMTQSGVMAMRVVGQLSPVAMTGGTTPPPVATAGGLTISLASDTPMAKTIADATAGNQILKLTFTASATASVNVTGVKLTKGGYFANTSVNSMGIFDSTGKRHGNEITTLGSDGVGVLTFSSDPIVVSAGTSTTALVKISLANVSNASGTIYFSVAQASDVMSSASTVTGNFPVMGNIMTVVEGSNNVATLTLDAQPVNASGATLNVDTASLQDVAKFRVQETSSNEAVNLYGLTLWNNGTAADGDIKDVQLLDQSDNVLATAQQVNKSVIFAFASPFFIDKGQTKDFKVKAKIVNGAARTVQFTVYNNYDIDARGVSSGAGLLPSAGSTDTSFPIGDVTSVYNKVTIGSGTLIFNRSAGTTSTSIVPGATAQTLVSYDAKAVGEDMEIRGLSFGIANASTTGTSLNGTVYVKVDGNIVFSAAGNTTNFPLAGTVTARTLSSYPIIKAGVTSTITVVADTSSSATTADKYTVMGFDITSVKRLVTNDIVDPSVTGVNGNQISIQAGSLVVSTLTTPVATTYVPTASGAVLATFQLNASASGEDIRVSSITVTDTLSGGSNYSDIANLVMYDEAGNALQTSSSTNTVAATVAFNFTNNILVTKTAPVTLTLKGDVVSNAVGVTHTFKIASASNVTATGKTTGNSIASASVSVSGSGQTMTPGSVGTVTASVVTGTGATPSIAQVVSAGTTGGTYFAFKLSSQYEAMKLTTLTLRASGTFASATTAPNDVRNIQLFHQVGSGAVATTAFANAPQFSSCSTTMCSYTWTASDNLLPVTIDPSAPVTIYVKADIGGAGLSYLGDQFWMGLNATTDLAFKGVQSASTTLLASGGVLNGTGATSSIVSFGVVVTGDYPTTQQTGSVSLPAGATLGRFKVTNSGSAKVTLTNAAFADNGSHTGTLSRYQLKYSDDGSTNYTANNASTTLADTLNFGDISSAAITINGGSYRYLSVILSTVGSATTGDTFQLAVSALGNLKFSVAEADLGYDGNQSGTITGSVTGLFVDGKPTLQLITKQ